MALRRGAVAQQETFSRLSEALSRVKTHLDGFTGADELARLAVAVAERDSQFAGARTCLRAAKDEFEAALQTRTAAQQEINALLQARPCFERSVFACRRPVFAQLTPSPPTAQAVLGV
jgi:hypothetical protein